MLGEAWFRFNLNQPRCKWLFEYTHIYKSNAMVRGKVLDLWNVI